MTLSLENQIDYTEAIILAGGFGTRLKEVITDLPKPMAPVNEIPFLNYLLDFLSYHGIKHVVISTGHLSEKITNYYNPLIEETNRRGIVISYSHENVALGTGGAIRLALEKCQQKNIFVLNGDSFFDFDIKHFLLMHKTKKAYFSLALRKVSDASRYGTVKCDHDYSIKSFKEKNNEKKEGIINAGIYLINKTEYLKRTEPLKNFSIEKDFFEKQLGEKKMLGFEFDGYFIDIGIPEDYAKAQNDFKEFKYR
ncbi:MAG: nucleotidyltransferase family protein [Bacteroidota bacterium]